MKRRLQLLTALVVALTATLSLSAQDLQSQRGESQDLGTLLGSKVDHQGLIINPTPQQIIHLRSMPVSIADGFMLRGKAKQFISDLDFVTLSKDGLPLSIEYGRKSQKLVTLKQTEGAYALSINHSGVYIVAYDELGAFYAIQTLRQIVESPVAEGGMLPALTINDWPDLHYRGVVEGFYGTPWSHEVRLSLIDVYGRYKMNYYIYGPKDDPYHSSPNWRQPYPEDEAAEIQDLVKACNRNRVNFVWAIHPGQDIKWNEEDYLNLLNKFEAMYQLGVRAFAIHFDDISGEGTNPLKQTALLNRLNEEFVKHKGDVASLIVCPTDYTRLWANPTERGSLVRYGETLDKSVDVFWTGDAVCSDLTEGTMEWVNSRIQRPALFWWNYPVTDYARYILMQGPVYGLSTEMTADKCRGLVSNPMEYGEASKLALYSVADYTWNTEAYNPIDSWERAIEAVAPEVKEAYRLFAIHSCDTETGYRRLESWETTTFRKSKATAALVEPLREELIAIEAVPAQMEAMHNKALLEEMRPWLVEFGKLGTRCRKAIEAMELYFACNYNAFWNAYVDNLMSEEDIAMYDAHRVGTMKLQPFYENLMDDLAADYYRVLTGELASTLTPYGNYRSLAAPQAKYMFDSDDATYYHSGRAQQTDDFVGADMGTVRPVREIRVIQGRNSVDDVDYFDHAILEYSVDGESWMPLTEPLQGIYDIEWRGEPIEARYVRLRKLESSKRNWLAIRAFEINPVPASRYHLDGNPYTALLLNNSVQVAIPADATHAVMLLGKLPAMGNAHYRLLDSKGRCVGEGDINSSRYQILLHGSNAVTLEISGVKQIYEVVFSGVKLNGERVGLSLVKVENVR